MWETIKNNVLLKAIIVVILGVLGFGLAFNIMFGRNTGEMGQEMNSSYSLDSALIYILLILVKVLLIFIALAALAAACKLSKKYLFEGRDNKVFETYKNDKYVKAASFIVASVLVIALIAMLFGNIFGGFGLAWVLIFFVKLLLAVSVVGLVTSMILYSIQAPLNLSAARPFNSERKSEYEFTCSKCGTEMKQGWKCCPNCGEEARESRPTEATPENNAAENETDEPEKKEDINEKLNDSTMVEVTGQAGYEKKSKKQSKR